MKRSPWRAPQRIYTVALNNGGDTTEAAFESDEAARAWIANYIKENPTLYNLEIERKSFQFLGTNGKLE